MSDRIHFHEGVEALSDVQQGSATANDVLEYLQQHPDFFKQHAEVIANIQLANAKKGNVISMAHWQTDVLRNKAEKHKSRLDKLLAQSSLNQKSYEKLLDLVILWLAQKDATQLPQQIESDLKTAFTIDAIVVMVWDESSQSMLHPVDFEWRESIAVFAKSLHAPYCGACKGFEIETLLAAQTDSGSIGSLAIVPLWGWSENRNTCLGVLLMGASDVSRFMPDMGTHLLTSIGDMAGAALSRFQSPMKD